MAATGEALLFEGPEWDFETLQRTFEAIEQIAIEDLGLAPYPTRLEVITAEQMLDAYAAVGLPVMYPHWSFGKRYVQHETLYRKGLQGLALEIVINSNPCLCYIMEENTMTTQAAVIAHAAMGHNHFFRNNQAFRQWTDAEAILDYLRFARSFVKSCEERYGAKAVERVLDAAHALADQGVDRFGRGERPDIHAEHERALARWREARESAQELWLRTVPQRRRSTPDEAELEIAAERGALGLPEENLLYFLEKHAPLLKDWQRELLRIVRNVASYFEPQKQTKVMNEGCATWCHYTILTLLQERGRISESAMLEFLHLHSSVIAQPEFDDPRFGGLNPYALGFAMMQDIARICREPTAEDRAWFPEIAGNEDPLGTLRHAWANFRDESFVLQYLSPKLIREFRLFKLHDDTDDPDLVVDAIHDEHGYRRVRRALARHYDPAEIEPRIEIVGADLRGDRTLDVEHGVRGGRQLDALEARRVLRHMAALWGYRVRLSEVDGDTGKTLAVHEQRP